MPPEEHTALQDLRRLLPASFLAGLVAGGLLALLTHAHAWCWGGIACYNHGLFGAVGTYQNLVLGILSLFLAGTLPAALSREGEGRRDAAVLAGGIAGFVAFLINELNFRIIMVFGRGSSAGPGDLLSAICSTLANHALSLLAMGLFTAALAALGAFVASHFRERAAGPDEGAAASRLLLCSTAALILIVAVLPPLAAHAMLGAGMIDVNPGTAMTMTTVSAERTAPDTIVVTVEEAPPASVLDPDLAFSVFIDGVDVSTGAACAAHSFAATVDPPGGLFAAEGAEAAWTGAGVSNDGTPVNVVVTAHGADGSEVIVLSRMV